MAQVLEQKEKTNKSKLRELNSIYDIIDLFRTTKVKQCYGAVALGDQRCAIGLIKEKFAGAPDGGSYIIDTRSYTEYMDRIGKINGILDKYYLSFDSLICANDRYHIGFDGIGYLLEQRVKKVENGTFKTQEPLSLDLFAT
jgi:hypothetical protein